MKKIRILIISLIIIIVLGCTTFAVLYFATDTFKSNKGSYKDDFKKYISQMSLKDFFDIETYNSDAQKRKTEKYSSEGSISLEITEEGETKDEVVKYNYKVDPTNKKSSGDINIVIDGENGLNLKYLQNNDLYGIQFKDIEQIANQYIVLENNNLKEFAEKLGISDADMPNKIEIPEQYKEGINSINFEELNKIFSKYLNLAFEQIPEENYTKVEKQNIEVNNETIEANGYSVKITSKDINNILNNILETMRNDEQVFNFLNNINQEITFEEYQESIDELIQSIDSTEQESEEETNEFNVTVYKNTENTVKIQITFEDKLEIFVENKKIGLNIKADEKEINLDIYKNEEQGYSLLAKFIEDDEEIFEINIAYNNKTTFDSNIKIEDFKEGEYAIINEYTGEQISNLFNNIVKLLVENTNVENEIITFSARDLLMAATIYNSSQNTVQNATQNLQKETERVGLFNIVMGVSDRKNGTISDINVLKEKIEENNSFTVLEQQTEDDKLVVKGNETGILWEINLKTLDITEKV